MFIGDCFKLVFYVRKKTNCGKIMLNALCMVALGVLIERDSFRYLTEFYITHSYTQFCPPFIHCEFEDSLLHGPRNILRNISMFFEDLKQMIDLCTKNLRTIIYITHIHTK